MYVPVCRWCSLLLLLRWCSFQVVDDVTEVQMTGDFQDAGPGSIDQATFQLLAALSEKDHMLPEALRLKVRPSAATRFPDGVLNAPYCRSRYFYPMPLMCQLGVAR